MSKKRNVGIAILAAGTILVSGCGIVSNSKVSAPAVNPATQSTANLYFLDHNGYVVPLASSLPKSDSPAGKALDYLVQGGSGEQLLGGTGLQTVLPKGTKSQLNIKDGLATVDFSKDILNYKTLKDEQEIVQSVVWTLTEFPTVKQVQIRVGGQVLQTLPKGTPIAAPLSRENGINLQIAAGTNPSQSSHVTVYLMDQTSTGNTYLVPVTRVIPKIADSELVKATLAQLSSTDGTLGLKSSLSSGDVYTSMNVKDDTAHVDLKNSVFPTGATPSVKADILKSIWMSVSSSLNVNKVQLTVQGQAVPVVSGKIDWSKPVSNLHFINAEPDKAI